MTNPRPTPATDVNIDGVEQQPVPVTVWYAPAAAAGDTMSTGLATRLLANFTHCGALVLDLTVGDQLARAAEVADRRHTTALGDDPRRVELIVGAWPGRHHDPHQLLADCVGRLTAGGSVAVVLAASTVTVNQRLIGAARDAGLTYAQHIVVAHDLDGEPTTDEDHLFLVHADVLVFVPR